MCFLPDLSPKSSLYEILRTSFARKIRNSMLLIFYHSAFTMIFSIIQPLGTELEGFRSMAIMTDHSARSQSILWAHPLG